MQRARKFSAVLGTTSARSCRNKVQREGRDDFDLETPPQPAAPTYGRQPNSGGLSAMVNFAQPAHSLTAPCSVALQVNVASPADFCSARVEELQHCVCRAPTEVTPPRRHDQRCSRVRSATAAPAQQKQSAPSSFLSSICCEHWEAPVTPQTPQPCQECSRSGLGRF